MSKYSLHSMITMSSGTKKRLASQCSFDDNDFDISIFDIGQIDESLQKHQLPNIKQIQVSSSKSHTVTPNLSMSKPSKKRQN